MDEEGWMNGRLGERISEWREIEGWEDLYNASKNTCENILFGCGVFIKIEVLFKVNPSLYYSTPYQIVREAGELVELCIDCYRRGKKFDW